MFGFQATNNGNSVLLSNNHRHLSFKERISLTITNTVVDRQSTAAATFSSPVISQAPPTVFVRLSSTRHPSLQMYCVILGSPGNWTGFQIYAAAFGGGTLPLYVLDCVVCHFSELGTSSDYGLVLYNGSGVPIYSHTEKLVKYSKFTKKWTLAVNTTGFTFYTLSSNIQIAADDYIDVSSLNRGVIAQLVDGAMFSSVRIYQNNAPTLELVMQANRNQSNPVGIPDMNFCIPICKFPVSVYHN